ncbi:hypothetical protein [Roseofilum casamattae]|uniref:Uncharacterized protein n=1 Tax=Roseofilum casamattae BLCC-M143 TaxID=3022442 RepID=A0ABT7BY87_9CYAN|nr:hypothetical protein [Roseofilum casamattae]MDJ1184164.1 hypothetical protein [Roseofilum casamattae BLCC-M143]
MSYGNFKLHDTIEQFDLTVDETTDLFAEIAEVEPSELTRVLLKENLPLALSINTEKARSEMIITPILLEMRRQLNYEIGLFSGSEFNADPEQGLNGICDFLISLSANTWLIQAPVIAVVEAKKEDIKSGLGQCIAEMLGAQLFNQREGNSIPVIYGAVTSGNIWKFLQLSQQTVRIDRQEYYINQVSKILGILISMVR